MSIVESLNNILRIIENKCNDNDGIAQIDPTDLDDFSTETEYLMQRIGLSPFQSILFAVIVEESSSRRCHLNHIGWKLGMSYLQMMSYYKDINELKEKGLIQIDESSEIHVPAAVTESLMKDLPFEKPKIDGLTTKALLFRIFKLMNAAYREEIHTAKLLEQVEILINANPQTCYSKACTKYLKSMTLTECERLLFYVCTYLYFKRGITIYEMNDIENFIVDETWMLDLKSLSDTNSLELQKAGIIIPANEDGILSQGQFCIKDEVLSELFADANIKSKNLKTIDLSDASSQPVKELFYNDTEKRQIERLCSLLKEDEFKKILESLKAKGLRTGFTCLFYGDSGTGKTETVYHLARQTGRQILEADVAKIRNCYVGETEKNMRALFNDYRTACKENERMPILLFNEADAILGTRMEGAVRSIDRMENSVQNILLQEMEKLNGIMIATTNMSKNLDPAFERRFLYKIYFTKPEVEPRSKIWLSLFPFLTGQQACDLAESYDFSGGQIENIVRKYTVDNILFGTKGTIEKLRQYCKEESLKGITQKRIGY